MPLRECRFILIIGIIIFLRISILHLNGIKIDRVSFLIVFLLLFNGIALTSPKLSQLCDLLQPSLRGHKTLENQLAELAIVCCTFELGHTERQVRNG